MKQDAPDIFDYIDARIADVYGDSRRLPHDIYMYEYHGEVIGYCVLVDTLPNFVVADFDADTDAFTREERATTLAQAEYIVKHRAKDVPRA